MEEVITELEDITPKISFNLEVLKEELDLTSKEVALVKKAIADFSPRVGTNSKVKIPKPSMFNGSRDAKEFENFLRDIYEYFKTTKISEETHVGIDSMYLTSNTKLWWHTRVLDDENTERHKISTSELMKKKLRNQFLPSNTIP